VIYTHTARATRRRTHARRPFDTRRHRRGRGVTWPVRATSWNLHQSAAWRATSNYTSRRPISHSHKHIDTQTHIHIYVHTHTRCVCMCVLCTRTHMHMRAHTQSHISSVLFQTSSVLINYNACWINKTKSRTITPEVLSSHMIHHTNGRGHYIYSSIYLSYYSHITIYSLCPSWMEISTHDITPIHEKVLFERIAFPSTFLRRILRKNWRKKNKVANEN